MSGKDAVDAGAALAVFGTLADVLPAVAAALGIVWYLIRIWEWARVAVLKKPPRTGGPA